MCMPLAPLAAQAEKTNSFHSFHFFSISLLEGKRKVTTTNTTSKQMASCKIMTELQQFNFSKQSGATPSFNTEAKIRDSEGSIGEDFNKALDDVSACPSQDLTTRLTLAFNCCRSRM
jgi:carbamoylphosphate synthase large subunit